MPGITNSPCLCEKRYCSFPSHIFLMFTTYFGTPFTTNCTLSAPYTLAHATLTPLCKATHLHTTIYTVYLDQGSTCNCMLAFSYHLLGQSLHSLFDGTILLPPTRAISQLLSSCTFTKPEQMDFAPTQYLCILDIILFLQVDFLH